MSATLSLPPDTATPINKQTLQNRNKLEEKQTPYLQKKEEL